MGKFMKCTCGKLFDDGAKLGRHRNRCVEFQKKKYYTTANLEKIRELIKKMEGRVE